MPKNLVLVAGFNPFLQNNTVVKLDHFPRVRGENIKYLKPAPRVPSQWLRPDLLFCCPPTWCGEFDVSIILHHAIWCPGDGKVPTGGEEILFRTSPQKNMANLLKPIVLSPYMTWTYTLWVTSVYLTIWDHNRIHQKGGIIYDSCHVWRNWWVHLLKHICTFPIYIPKNLDPPRFSPLEVEHQRPS